MRGFSRIPLLAALAVAIACSDEHMPTGLDPITSPVQPEVAFSEGTGGGGLESTATVWTDKDDYQPGDIVTITGAGWAPGELVHLHIVEDPPNHPDHHFDVVADEEGGFVHAELVMDELHLGVTFTLTATGETSGMVATAVFTDNHGTHNVRFATFGLSISTSIEITGSRHIPGNHNSQSYDVSFTSPGPSAAIGTAAMPSDDAAENLTFTFSGFPAEVTEGITVCSLIEISHTSPLTAGGHQQTTTVTAIYDCVETADDPRPTSTSVECAPVSVVVNQQTTCTVTVTDEGDGTASDPEGEVAFSVSGGNSSNDDFSDATCELEGNGDGTSECSVTYTPSGASTHEISADYEGSADHEGSSSEPFGLTVNKRGTETVLTCDPEVQKVGFDITCTATVTDDEAEGTAEAPAGDVEFERNGAGVGSCTLAAVDGESSSCSFAVTSPVPTVDDMQAFYVGPSNVHDSSESGIALAVFYDPEAGFVTGGGWIYSMPGHYRGIDNANLEGKATFGFVSKYRKGASVPDGNTQFVFHAGGLNFHSSQYEWLVVNQNGANAQFKGVGRLNGVDGYGFMIWATDGSPDSFRIKIWYGDENSPVYDNDGEQDIGGGSIVIHTGGSGKK